MGCVNSRRDLVQRITDDGLPVIQMLRGEVCGPLARLAGDRDGSALRLGQDCGGLLDGFVPDSASSFRGGGGRLRGGLGQS